MMIKKSVAIASVTAIAVCGCAVFQHADETVVMPSCKGTVASVDYGVASEENGTMPPSKYVIDYYAPPTDWFPASEVRNYTMNTRVPDLYWLKYEGAYTLALRIRMQNEKNFDNYLKVGIQNKKVNAAARVFDVAREKQTANRKVGVYNLNVPGNDFIEFSFKMRSKTKKPNPDVIVNAMGIGQISTRKNVDASVKCSDGFTAYKIKFPERAGRILKAIEIIVPPSDAYDPDECYEFFDLNLKRSAPRPRFTDLPQRQWIRRHEFERGDQIKKRDGIADVVEFVRSNPPEYVKSKDISLAKYELRTQSNASSDTGFKTKQVKVDINGRMVDAIQITLTNGRRCYLKFPTKFNAREFNTLTFYSKIELPGDLPKKFLYGEDVPNLYGTDAPTLNRCFDTFTFGIYAAGRDPYDWGQYGIGHGLSAYHRDRQAKVPAGWNAHSFDFLNSDCAGNKNTYLPEITHFYFYYNNAKIPQGATVTITIADPKVSTGLMLAGGELDKYRKFLKDRDAGAFIQKNFGKPFSSDDKYLTAPEENRLDSPLPLVRNHIPQFEIVLPGRISVPPAYSVVINRALDYLNDFLCNKYGLTHAIPRVSSPTKNDNVKIFLGSEYYSKVDKNQVAADKKKFKGNPGCAIRTRGKNIYIYGGQNNYANEARGIVNGIYVWLENNTDEILVQIPGATRWDKTPLSIFEFDKSGNMDAIWGKDYVNAPLLQYWSLTGSNKTYSDRNMSVPDDWHLGHWDYAGRRQHTCNHWWGYGTEPYGNEERGKPNERWGLGENGKRMVPGCYSGHPCMINVLERAKESYRDKAYFKIADNPQAPKGMSYTWMQQDTFGLWVEDTLRVCVCDKCTTPIRLANGSLVKYGDVAFRGTQFYANACAMIHAVNVHARRNMKIESIAYFWMSPIPLFEISRNYEIRFCPYIRKNYSEPIFAPCNDIFWRDFNRWSQLQVGIGVYEYFLEINNRPWTDVFQYDYPEETARRLSFSTPESDNSALAQMEHWTLMRYFWDASADPRELRRRYIRRAYREAAPAIEKFRFTLDNFMWNEIAPNYPMEFEDESQLGMFAALTPSKVIDGTLADELDGYLEEAQRLVKNPNSKRLLDALVQHWRGYIKKARNYSATVRNK